MSDRHTQHPPAGDVPAGGACRAGAAAEQRRFGNGFAQIPPALFDALAAKKITPQAFALYAILLRYVNPKRGDGKVWPSRATLAQQMGFSKVESVDKYMRELIREGFVLKETRKSGTTNLSNVYILACIVERGSAELGTTSAEPNTGLPSGETPGGTPQIGGTTPHLGGGVPHICGPGVPPKRGLELEEEQLQEVQLEESSSRASSSSSSPRTSPRRDDEDDDVSVKNQKPSRKTRNSRQQADQQRRRDEARQQILEDTTADEIDLEALVTYYEEESRFSAKDGLLYAHGVLYRDGLTKLEEHLDDARYEHDEWITRRREAKEREAQHIQRGQQIANHVAKCYRNITPAVLEQIAAAWTEALRNGIPDKTIADAVDPILIKPPRTRVGRAILDAIKNAA